MSGGRPHAAFIVSRGTTGTTDRATAPSLRLAHMDARTECRHALDLARGTADRLRSNLHALLDVGSRPGLLTSAWRLFVGDQELGLNVPGRSF